jgi:hypothetical protein
LREGTADDRRKVRSAEVFDQQFDAEQHASNLSSPTADQAAELEHLSGVKLQVDLGEAAGAKAPRLQHNLRSIASETAGNANPPAIRSTFVRLAGVKRAASFRPPDRQSVGSARLLRDLAAYRFCTLPERNRRRFGLRAVPGVPIDRRQYPRGH